MTIKLKNPGVIRFNGRIVQSDNVTNSWAWVEFPYDLREQYGKGNLVPVIMTFDGISYRGSITRMRGKSMLLIKRDILNRLSKKKGDSVEVTVTLDDAPRKVDIPQELQDVLNKSTEAKARFEKLAYTHRKEYARWVESAKQQATRENRAKRTIEMIQEKNS
jgi:hypothetical protein